MSILRRWWGRLRRSRAVDGAVGAPGELVPSSPPGRDSAEATPTPTAAPRTPDRGADRAARGDALARLRAARGTLEEASVVTELLTDTHDLDEATECALAEVLAARGEAERAIELLERNASVRGGMLRADLLAEAGRQAEALAAVERVLARDLSAPGALERQARWSRALGAAPMGPRGEQDVTALLPTSAEAPFVLRRELARGGGGAVYEADDPVLLRRVALKIHHGGANASAAVAHELRMLEALRGRGVVRVVDASPVQGWIALEWAPRGSLRDQLEAGEGPQPWPVLAQLQSLAEALARVHHAGWVHHDVKPSNVLLADDGEVLLTDFGIARPVGEPATGGSPGYLAPERLAGAPASPADDVYGLGRIAEDITVRAPTHVARQAVEELARRCLCERRGRLADGAEVTAWIRRARSGA